MFKGNNDSGPTIVSAVPNDFQNFYIKYNKFVKNTTEWNTEFENWKTGKSQSLEFYVSPNIKITLGALENYKTESGNPQLKKFISDNFKNNKDSQRKFYKDVTEVKKELTRFKELTTFVEKKCELRSDEGSKIINPELANADTVINDICVLQNQGNPSIELQILGNTEPYENKHIYNILKGSSTKGGIKESIEKSRIIKSMFEIIKGFSNSNNTTQSGGVASTDSTKVTEEPKDIYETIARNIKFIFFTVINWSPDTELPDRVQYYHNKDLRDLLKSMTYESEFETYPPPSKSNANKYIETFNTLTDKIINYYKKQGLTHVTEISELLKHIEEQKTALKNASNYTVAIRAVQSIVDESNNVNASTLIGSIANEGRTCIEQKDSGVSNLTKIFKTDLRPKPV